MDPTHFDRLAMALSAGLPRRQVCRRIVAAIAAGVASSWSARRAARATICGPFDTSEDVELYRGDRGVPAAFVAAHQGSVGLLRWNTDLPKRYLEPGNVNGARWCSGTLIGEDLFLTAGHCLENRPLVWQVPRIDGTDLPITRAEVAANMHVDFNYQIDPDGNDRSPASFAVAELVEDRLGDLDYAILRLANNPGVLFGVATIAAENPPAGSAICIIGHPEGTPKRVDCGHVLAVEDIRIFYNDVSTRGGSAGSGIFSSPEGALVGIHTTGACTDADIGSNYGVAIGGLLQVSPIAQTLAEL